MANWKVWEVSFCKVTLRDDGDSNEVEGVVAFNLDKRFSNYEKLWQRHVVPATNRPANINHREYVDTDYARFTQVSHGVFCDILDAERALVKVKGGDYGGNRYQTCQEVLKQDGNAMQKYDDLNRKQVEPMLKKLGKPFQVWTKAQWASTWEPRYTPLSAYRNFLIHNGNPQVMLLPQAGGAPIPYVPHEAHFKTYEKLSWPEQEARYNTHPGEWDTFSNVCERVHNKTVSYLDDAYAEVLKLLDTLVTDEDYQNLWGWDTIKYGSQAARRAVVTRGAFSGYSGPSGSGHGFVPAQFPAPPPPPQSTGGGSGVKFAGS